MTILSLDPSSTCAGYAVFVGDRLKEFGRLTPNRTRDDANARICAIASALGEVIEQHMPELIVIEDTSGKVGRRHKGAGAGLAVHGKSIGYLWHACEMAAPVKMVAENEWTRGVPKPTRQATVALIHGFTNGAYWPADDPGGDIADAIGLGDWYIARQRVEEAAA